MGRAPQSEWKLLDGSVFGAMPALDPIRLSMRRISEVAKLLRRIRLSPALAKIQHQFEQELFSL
jgi:hypothetical protein